jgi:hypothetical protein
MFEIAGLLLHFREPLAILLALLDQLRNDRGQALRARAGLESFDRFGDGLDFVPRDRNLGADLGRECFVPVRRNAACSAGCTARAGLPDAAT